MGGVSGGVCSERSAPDVARSGTFIPDMQIRQPSTSSIGGDGIAFSVDAGQALAPACSWPCCCHFVAFYRHANKNISMIKCTEIGLLLFKSMQSVVCAPPK
jgi:hypothetical protein